MARLKPPFDHGQSSQRWAGITLQTTMGQIALRVHRAAQNDLPNNIILFYLEAF